MTYDRQTSTLSNRRLDQQQSAADSQRDNLALNRSIDSNREILNSHTDLILSLTRITNHAATQEQNRDLKDIMLKILRTNIQIYEIVLNMHSHLPHQVERQQPVLFLDACNRLAPVHLEFITSANAFLAVLIDRFKDAGSRKIRRGEFVLEEARSKRLIDLRRPWHTCFLPGQKIAMSMSFSQPKSTNATCPGCQCEAESHTGEDIEW